MKTIKALITVAAAGLAFAFAGNAQAQACGDACHADILTKTNGAATAANLTLVMQAVTALRADVAAGARTRHVFEIDTRDWADNQVPLRCENPNFGTPFTANGLVPIGACTKTDTFCPKLNSPADPQGGEVLKFRTIGLLITSGNPANYTIRKLFCESFYAK